MKKIFKKNIGIVFVLASCLVFLFAAPKKTFAYNSSDDFNDYNNCVSQISLTGGSIQECAQGFLTQATALCMSTNPGATAQQCSTSSQNPSNPTTTNNPPANSNPSNPAQTLGCPSGTSNTNGNGLCLPSNSAFGSGIAGSTSLVGLILQIINILLILAGLVAIVMIIVGGFWYITSAGNEETAEKGKSALINAIIGLVVVLLAFAIVNVLANTLTSGSILTNSSAPPIGTGY